MRYIFHGASVLRFWSATVTLGLCSCYLGSGDSGLAETASSTTDDGDSSAERGSEGIGETDETGDSDDTGDSGGTGESEVPCALIERRIRRLGPEQYDNTVAALIPGAEAETPSQGWRSSFTATQSISHSTDTLTLASPHVYDLMRVAQGLAAKVSAQPSIVAQCMAEDSADVACHREFVTNLLDRAFRRPPTDIEIDDYADFLGEQLAAYDIKTAIEQATTRALVSPDFLFRSELGDMETSGGDDDESLELTAYEQASQISYFLSDAPPDALLRAAAETGVILDDSEKAKHIARLLENSETSQGVRRFVLDHIGSGAVLEANKDIEVFPQVEDPAVFRAMADETDAYVSHILWSDTGNFSTLMRAPYTFVNQSNAGLYGLDPTEFDESFIKYDFTTQRRAGFLTQPSLMAVLSKSAETGIVSRGLYMMENILCLDVPPPPDGINAVTPDFDESAPMTQRERIGMHTEDPSCASCHSMFDPLGFAFEHYDALGGWRDDEHGLPIDASGMIPSMGSSPEIPTTGPVEMVEALAGHPAAQHCFAQRLYTYTFARHGHADRCAIDTLDTELTAGTVLDAVTEMILSEQFSTRRFQDDEN